MSSDSYIKEWPLEYQVQQPESKYFNFGKSKVLLIFSCKIFFQRTKKKSGEIKHTQNLKRKTERKNLPGTFHE